MCFIRDLRDYGETAGDARALFLAAVLASRTEGGATIRFAFTGMVMLHAAQFFAERVADETGLTPDCAFLGLLGHCGIDVYEDDPARIGPVVALDGAAGRFFAQTLREDAERALDDSATAAQIAAACVAIARSMFAAFAVQSGAAAEAEGICGAAAYVRLLTYEVKH